ncbi:MAG: pyridoxal-dependent decarboxylase [Anaeromyxobacteraceae bacterium]
MHGTGPEELRALLARAAELAGGWLGSLDQRGVGSTAPLQVLREALGGALPEGPAEPREVLERLAAAAEPGLVASPGGRFFGFVVGASLPAAVAADWLTTAWDQNAGLAVLAPAASVVEEVAHRWLAELLGLPAGTSFAATTGCQMAHFTCLAAARHELLRRAGWDVNRDGLEGAPRLRVVAGERRHVTIDRALRFLGLGQAALRAVPCDGQGRMVPAALAAALGAEERVATIVCAQAGEVNTGAFDDLDAVARLSAAAGAWLHVDGAFGLWAAASPARRGLLAGVERADSWATDAHKWLNVPYDCGLAFTAHPAAHRAAMGVTAAYLEPTSPDAGRDPVDWTPEFSRRARGFTLWAALRALGRRGVAGLVDRCCAHAERFAAALAAEPGCAILNDVVLDQVLVRFGDDDAATREVVRRVQASGEAWMSGTTVDGEAAMRISVVSWRTTEADVDRAVEAIRAAWRAVRTR